jgi:hypothetical protein
MRRHLYALSGLCAADRANLALLHLTGFESAESGEDDAVAVRKSVVDSVKDCIESSVTLGTGATKILSYQRGQVTFS